MAILEGQEWVAAEDYVNLLREADACWRVIQSANEDVRSLEEAFKYRELRLGKVTEPSPATVELPHAQPDSPSERR